MATPLSQFDLTDTISKAIDFVERTFNFSPGVKGILKYLGVDPANATVSDLFAFIVTIVALIVAAMAVFFLIRVTQHRSMDKTARRELHKRKNEKKDDKKWKQILSFAHTDNPHDWKLAIREADILLDVVVTEKGVRGTTFEEKIKRMPDSEDAGLAHEAWINYIQKGGDEYILTKSKTKEILGYYERALKNLGYL